MSDPESPFVVGSPLSISAADGLYIVDVVGSAGGMIRFQVTEHQAMQLLSRLDKEKSLVLTLELASEKSLVSAVRQAVDDLSLTRYVPSDKDEASAFIRRTIDDVVRSLTEAVKGGF